MESCQHAELVVTRSAEHEVDTSVGPLFALLHQSNRPEMTQVRKRMTKLRDLSL